MIRKPCESKPTGTDPRARAGDDAQRQLAHYLHRAFATTAEIEVIHDLRLVDDEQPDQNGKAGVCQIDHPLIHQWGCFIVESKSVSTEVRVRADAAGGDEWTRIWNGKEQGISSPIQQAKRQAKFLRTVLQRNRRSLLGRVPVGARTLVRIVHGDDQRGFRTAPIQLVIAISDWMRDQRGLSAETVRVYRRMVNEFFDSQAKSRIPLISTTITDVDRFITVKNARGRYRRKTISLYAVSLRAFFRFAANHGWCMPEIAPAIKPPRVLLDEPIPNGLNRADVQRLLSTTEGDRPADKRDRAILMLLAGYGLRAGEVRGLQLDDVNWEQETLRVRRPKSGRSELYPLSRGVAQAILRYLLEVRPTHHERTLFLALTAPIRPLSHGALATIVRDRLKRLGIVAGRRGPHALRHAAAQHLLDQGMSMKVIGDYLGHRSQSTTAVYAKVHLTALREVADFELECLT